jgi:hypothetical protein
MKFRDGIALPGCFVIVLLWGYTSVMSQETEDEAEVGIADNSFLIEEAYNQEPGVVQTIFNAIPTWDRQYGVRQSRFDFVFTQEWPVFSQRHQFSYTLPMLYSAERPQDGPLEETQGFGDLFLNYRYQLFDGKGDLPAVAPRFSVILRTGEAESGCKCSKPGYQFNLPISKQFERWAFHANVGWTTIPGLHRPHPELPPECRTDDGFNLGGSAIYFLRPNFHLMLEALALWGEEATPLGEQDRPFELLLNPGFRWAPYTEGSTQWVVGVGVPVGLTDDAPDVSLFLYMSLEQRFCKERG